MRPPAPRPQDTRAQAQAPVAPPQSYAGAEVLEEAPRADDGGGSGGRGKLWLALVAALVVIGGAVALSAYVWPGWVTKTLSQTALQDGVQRVLTEGDPAQGYGLKDVSDVSCPSGMKAQAGETFTCQVKVGDQNQRVTIKVTDDDGTYEVSAPAD